MGTPADSVLPDVPGLTLSQSGLIHYFCSGPMSVDPICPQPKGAEPITVVMIMILMIITLIIMMIMIMVIHAIIVRVESRAL